MMVTGRDKNTGDHDVTGRDKNNGDQKGYR